MGRPKGSLNKSTLAKMAKEGQVKPETVPEELPVVEEEPKKKKEEKRATTKEAFMSPIFECQLCKDLIWSEHEGHMKYCGCGKSFVDATRYYVRATIAAKRTGEFKEVL